MAAAATIATFLQLPPDLGGMRFGPFTGIIQIGSDARRNQLVLDPSHGIYPHHATIADMGNGTYTIAPAGRDCKVFLLQTGQVHVWPLNAPVQAKAGDMVIFGTPHGPRFQLQQEQQGPGKSMGQVATEARNRGGEAGLIHGINGFIGSFFAPAKRSGIGGEVQRRAQANMLANAGPMRSLYTIWTRMRTGALANPYYIVGAIIAVVGLAGTGSVSCSGIVYIIWDTLGL